MCDIYYVLVCRYDDLRKMRSLGSVARLSFKSNAGKVKNVSGKNSETIYERILWSEKTIAYIVQRKKAFEKDNEKKV